MNRTYGTEAHDQMMKILRHNEAQYSGVVVQGLALKEKEAKGSRSLW